MKFFDTLLPSDIARKALRFFLFSFGGLFVDITVATLVATIFNAPLIVAGLCGVLAAATTYYFMALQTTFKDKGFFATGRSFYKYVQSYLVGIVTRIVSLPLLEWFTPWADFICLFVVIVLSIVVTRVLAHFYVFRAE